MIATVAATIAALTVEGGLNELSVVFDELVDINIPALVSIRIVELLLHLFFEFRCATLLRDLRVGLLKGNAVVAIFVNGAQAEFLVDSFLVLLGKLALGDYLTGR